MWKFQNFSAIQILREINVGEWRSSKITVFATLGVLKFVKFVNYRLQNVQKFIENQDSEPQNVLNLIWQILHFYYPQD